MAFCMCMYACVCDALTLLLHVHCVPFALSVDTGHGAAHVLLRACGTSMMAKLNNPPHMHPC